MLKKFFSVLLVASLLFVAPPAANRAAGEDSSDGVAAGQVAGALDLSLDDAINLAAENNSNLKRARIALEKSKVTVNQAHLGASNIPYESATTLELGKVKFYNEKAARAALDVAEKTYEATYEQVKLLVKKDYLDVLKKKELVSVKQEAVKRAEKQLEVASASYGVGTVAKTDVLAAQVGLAQARAELIGAENNLRLAEIKLCSDLGIDTNTSLNLTSTVQYEPFEPVDLSSLIDEAMSGHLEIARCRSAAELAEEYYRIVVKYTSPATFAAQTARAEMEAAGVDLEDAKNKVISDVTGCYLSVLAAEETVKTYQAALEQAREAWRLTNLRYEVGMATSLDVMSALVQLSNVEANTVEAVYNHHLAVQALKTSKLALTSSK